MKRHLACHRSLRRTQRALLRPGDRMSDTAPDFIEALTLVDAASIRAMIRTVVWAEAGAGSRPAPELDQLFFPFSTLIGISFAPGLMSPTFAVISSIPSAYRAAMVFSMTPAGSGMVRENDP